MAKEYDICSLRGQVHLMNNETLLREATRCATEHPKTAVAPGITLEVYRHLVKAEMDKRRLELELDMAP